MLPLDPDLLLDEPDIDDRLHVPDPIRNRRQDEGESIFTMRGLINLGCLFTLIAGLLALLYVFSPPRKPNPLIDRHPASAKSAGYPLITALTTPKRSTMGGFNLGGINGSGQVPDIANMPLMVDRDTPQDVRTRVGTDGRTYNLVFSDEFNTDNRSFYPGGGFSCTRNGKPAVDFAHR